MFLFGGGGGGGGKGVCLTWYLLKAGCSTCKACMPAMTSNGDVIFKHSMHSCLVLEMAICPKIHVMH